MVDFHSHFLFGVDDGARDINMSLAMLNMSNKQGVKTIVAAPHYHADTVKSHVAVRVRNENFKKLDELSKTENVKIPDVRLGFEVRVQKKLLEIRDFSDLCIENTNTILLEMPTAAWTEDLLDVVEYIKQEHKLDIVIAHFERYVDRIPNELIVKLLEKDLYIQINASSFVNKDRTELIYEMFRNGVAHLIGSDAHNMVSRCSLMDIAYTYIRKNIGQECVDRIDNTAKKLLNL